MYAEKFPESNHAFGPPAGMNESQVMQIRAYIGEVAGPSSVEGSSIIVTAWKPTPEEIARIVAGSPIFISMLSGGLPPHFVTTNFHEATHPA